ncbi:hypothetical protein NKH61_20080 [Mesorhizobium sp. M1005]|uniref:hypothetical protein n=1 Tax=unclassified Mesorhizobium TaxID=325217 RepID=UPI00333DA478
MAQVVVMKRLCHTPDVERLTARRAEDEILLLPKWRCFVALDDDVIVFVGHWASGNAARHAGTPAGRIYFKVTAPKKKPWASIVARCPVSLAITLPRPAAPMKGDLMGISCAK